MLKVSKTALLFIAGIVWLAAGVNIARLGILSFGQMGQSMWWMLVIGAIAVFTVFHIKVFSKMVGKHANRIAGYVEDKIAFFYTGLGIALALSGMSFLGRFVRRGNLPVPCPLPFLLSRLGLRFGTC